MEFLFFVIGKKRIDLGKIYMKNIPLWISVVGLGFIITYTYFFNPSDFCYDEPIYLDNLDLIRKYGFSREFVLRLVGPAGPLHATIHWLAQPVTHLQVVPTRTINIVFTFIIIWVLFNTINLVNPGKGYISFLLLAIPMTYPTVGMALTEVPAMVFFVGSIFLLLKFFKNAQVEGNKGYGLIIISGLIMSLAILGRQPYILTFGAFLILYFYKFSPRVKIGILLFLVMTFAFPLVIFSIWQNIVPKTGGDIATSKVIEPTHFLLALGYSFLIFGILSPSFLVRINTKLFIIYITLFIALTLISYSFGLSYTPLLTMMKRLMPEIIWIWYGYILFSLLVVIGIYFLHSCFMRVLERYNDFYYVLFLLMLLAIVFSCITITHVFSSRYVFQAAPLFLIIASYHVENIRIKNLALYSLGVFLGILSLINYC